mgnify:CR=1 FL=1
MQRPGDGGRQVVHHGQRWPHDCGAGGADAGSGWGTALAGAGGITE